MATFEAGIPRKSPFASQIAVLVFLCVAIIGSYNFYRALRPSALPVEVAASHGGDRLTLDLASGDKLQFILKWAASNDLDLAVVTPSGEHIWYGNLGSTESDGLLDRDNTRGPGVEKIRIAKVRSGSYRVTIQNYSKVGNSDFQLIVMVNGKARKVYSGTVSEKRQSYILELEVHR
jgi:uncharacterized protein YfaP (DUF2135 family)